MKLKFKNKILKLSSNKAKTTGCVTSQNIGSFKEVGIKAARSLL